MSELPDRQCCESSGISHVASQIKLRPKTASCDLRVRGSGGLASCGFGECSLDVEIAIVIRVARTNNNK